MPNHPTNSAPIPHIVLLGDALGDMPRLQEQGELESRLLPDLKIPWRLTVIQADDVINRSIRAEIPTSASYVVISVEGNRAIQSSGLLEGRPVSYEEALARLSFAADQFEGVIRTLIKVAQRAGLPTVVCTMYPPRYSEPVQQRAASAALAIFNDRIIALAVEARISVVDFRSVCGQADDFGDKGLLSRSGLSKVAQAIWHALHESSLSGPRTEIFR